MRLAKTRRVRDIGTVQSVLSRISTEDAVAIALCVVCLVFLYNYVNIQVPVRVPSSPDENGVLSTSKWLVEKQTIFWKSSLNERYGVKFFRPRLFAEVAPNTYVTAHSIGFVFFLAIARELRILSLVVSLTAAAGVLAAYGAVAQVYDKKAGILVAATVGLLPTFVYFSNAYYDNVPSLSFYMISLFAFFRYLRTLKTWQLVASSFFLAVAILLRPYNVIFTLGYLAAVVVLRPRPPLKPLAIGALCFLVFLVPLLILNEYAYGSPLAIGFSSTTGGLDVLFLQRTGFDVYWVTFVNHIAMLSPVLFTLGVFGAIVVWKQVRAPAENALLAHLVTVSVASFALFGFLTRTFAFYEVSPASSVSRYLMPVSLLLALCACVLVKRVLDLGMKRVSILLISLLLVSLVSGSFASNALPSLVMAEQKYSSMQRVIDALPEDSVVFTRTYDKLIFPHRNVALLYTNSDLANNPDLRFFVPIVDIDRDAIPAIRKLLLDGVRVFLAGDVDDLADHLVRSGYIVRRIDNTLGLHEVSLSGIHYESAEQEQYDGRRLWLSRDAEHPVTQGEVFDTADPALILG